MELSTTVHLSPLANDQFQAIYASQNYGTFYGISANFKIENNFLKSVTFKLTNYKGLINLGIDKVIFEENLKCTKMRLIPNPTEVLEDQKLSKDISVITFTIFVKALINEKEKSLENLNIPLEPIRSNNDNEKPYIFLKRELSPMNENEMVFDEEFYYRDGLRKPYEFQEPFTTYRKGDVKDCDDPNTEDLFYGDGAGLVCPHSLSRIIL